MNKKIREAAIDLEFLESIKVSTETGEVLGGEQTSPTEQVRYTYDDSISNEELLLLAELKTCRNVRTIKNIVVTSFVLSLSAATIYLITLLASLY